MSELIDDGLRFINYHNLNVNEPGLRLIADYVVEDGILAESIDEFVDPQFGKESSAGKLTSGKSNAIYQ